MEKNMSMVSRFEDEMQRKIFLGQCMNNASVLIAGSFAGGDVKLVTAKAVFDYGKALFDAGMEADWLNYGKFSDSRVVNKDTGKVEGKVEYPSHMTQDDFKADDKAETPLDVVV